MLQMTVSLFDIPRHSGSEREVSRNIRLHDVILTWKKHYMAENAFITHIIYPTTRHPTPPKAIERPGSLKPGHPAADGLDTYIPTVMMNHTKWWLQDYR